MKKIECFLREWNIPGLQKVLRIMKLTAFILVLSVISAFAGKSYSQTKVLSLNISNSSVKEVLQDIESRSEFVFMYSEKLIDVSRRVSIDIKNRKIDEVLEELFAGSNVTYKIKDRFILLSPPEVTGDDFMAQQQKTITGKVTDIKGQPLPGVTVVVKGTTTGTITNADGNYSISNVRENATLVFSFVGMRTQEVEIGSQNRVNVTLEEDAIGIEEVVAVGYGVQKKISLTSAVGTADGDKIKVRNSTDVRQLLQGQMAGLTITDKGGAPGKATIDMNIRGITTLGNNSPLVIVDGIEQQINDVNPLDIQSVTLLKDASSTSIYGSRAANGVILVTTKRASEGKFRVAYNGYYGWQKSNNIPVHMGTEEYMRLQNVAYTNSSGAPVYTEEYIKEYVNATDRYKYPLPNTWFDAMLKIAPQHSHTLSLKGGNEMVKSYASFRYMDQDGIITNYNSEILEIRLNNDYRLSEKLNISTDFNFRQKEILTPRDEWGVINKMQQTSQWTVPKYPDGTYGISSDGHNPLLYAEQGGTIKTINSYLTGNVSIQWEIVKGLKFKSQLAGRLTNISAKQYQNKYEVKDYYNSQIIKKSQPMNNLRESRDYEKEITLNNLLEYNLSNEIHSVNMLLGYSEISNQGNNLFAFRQNFYNNDLQSLSAGADDATKNNGGTEYAWGLRSYFGRFNYAYKNKYLFEANGRYDGSSRFYGNNKYSFFPSFSGGWRISEEKIWSRLKDKVNEFKLRGSFGKTGNQAIGLYSYFETLSKGKYSFSNSLQESYLQTTMANKDIQWETTTQLDIGIDLQALDNRIVFSADYYKKRTDGILLTLPVPGTLGLEPSVQNAGVLDNTGWEFMFGTKTKFGSFSLNTNTFLSVNKNEVVDLAGTGPYIYGDSEIRFIVGEGYPYYGFWGYKTGGLFQTAEEVAGYPNFQAGTAPGDVKYLDLNGDKKIDAKDYTYLGGSYFPKYTFGSDINLSYKNFSLNLLFQGAAGTKRNIGGAIMQMGIWGGFTHEIFTNNYWTPENRDARFPRPLKYSVRNTQLSDRSLQDGSYLRLKNAQLNYQIPGNLTSKIGIDAMSVYVSGTNLLTFSKLNKWDVDPESDNRTPEVNYPQTSVYSLGINVNF